MSDSTDTPNRVEQALAALADALRDEYGPRVGYVMGIAVGNPNDTIRLSNICPARQRLMLVAMLEELPAGTEHSH